MSRAATREAEMRDRLATALAALDVDPPHAYTWLGRRTLRYDTVAGPRAGLLERLQDQLYADFYCRGGVPERNLPGNSPAAVKQAFCEWLADANSGRTTWGRRWEVVSVERDQARVRLHGLELVVGRRELDLPLQRLGVGDRVSVAIPASLFGVSPGYYVATGTAGDGAESDPHAVRVYFNLPAGAAGDLVGDLTGAFNRRRLPFRLKVLDDPLRFERCDASVVIIPRSGFAAAAPLLRIIVGRLAAELRPAVPAFTKRLAAGVGLAEDPDWKGGSFGAHRCRVIAEGAIDAAERGVVELDERVDVVAAAFDRAGITLAAPHLNPGSEDGYVL